MQTWSPTSWQNYTNTQAVEYASPVEAQRVLQNLSSASPLVNLEKIKKLQAELQQVAQGQAFILQAGECAERFMDADPAEVQAQLSLLKKLTHLLMNKLQKPTLTIGRIAGQYAKPRSMALETIEGINLPNYRGDLINDLEFSAEARAADPRRLSLAYTRAKACLESIESIAPEIYTSHEALHLAYEQSLTRLVDSHYYNLATHFPWIGVRTSDPQCAHVEYMRGLRNPIAVKIGTQVDAAWIKKLVYKLNPNNELGRLSFIHRFGESKIADHLPTLIDAVQQTQISVIWICDPMHGNTIKNQQSIKLRSIEAILSELKQAFAIHQHLGSYLGGLHLELTSKTVTECIGGRGSVSAEQVAEHRSWVVDPRLNELQAIEIIEGM